MASKYMKYSTSLVIEEMQIKTTLRFHLIPVRMAIFKSNNNYNHFLTVMRPCLTNTEITRDRTTFTTPPDQACDWDCLIIMHALPQFFLYLNLKHLSVSGRWTEVSTVSLPTACPGQITRSPFSTLHYLSIWCIEGSDGT
jgi:hypothetical protein